MGGEFRTECTYICIAESLLPFTRNYHKIVNRLYPKAKSVLKNKIECILKGLPRWLCGKESYCRRRGVQSLGQEDPLEEETATYSSILAWRIPWTEEPGKPQSMGLQKSWTRLKQPSTHARTQKKRPINCKRPFIVSKFHPNFNC